MNMSSFKRFALIHKFMIAVAFRTFSICFFANAYNLSVEELDDRRAQCPVTETVDSLRIIIADWADEGRGKKGERRDFTQSSRGAQWFVILYSTSPTLICPTASQNS